MCLKFSKRTIEEGGGDQPRVLKKLNERAMVVTLQCTRTNPAYDFVLASRKKINPRVEIYLAFEFIYW
jgi:uncharacterized UPF0146 family protein